MMCSSSVRTSTRPNHLAPGEFWTDYRFTRELIVLDEQLEISVPHGRAVKLKSAASSARDQRSGRLSHLHLAEHEPSA